MKFTNAIRLAAMLLAFLMILTAIGCGKADNAQDTSANDTAQTTTTVAAGETTATTEATTLYPDDLPEDLSYNGQTVTFLYREEIAGEFTAEVMTGDIVNDAIYESMLSVEERFGIDIQVMTRKGHTTDVRTEYLDHVDNQILAGDDTYDWVDMMMALAVMRIQSGNYHNLLNLKNLHLDQPWYIPNMEETASVADRLFFIVGDSSLGYLKTAFCFYVNHDVAKSYGIEDLNTLVKDGKWTMEKAMQFATVAAQDLNSDGKYDLEDRLGLVIHDANHRLGFMCSTGIQTFTKNADGSHSFTFGTDKDHAICTSIYQLKNETQGSYYYAGTNAVPSQIANYNKISSMFIGDQIMMLTAEMDDVIACGYHTMESDYGVLPYPKYDEAQEQYYTASRTTHNAFLMPINCPDPEMSAAVMEALSASNYQKVLPKYFELALKTKYAADAESAVIFDIIHDSMILDFGYIYTNVIGKPHSLFSKVIDNVDSFASRIEGETGPIKNAYDNFIKTVNEKCPD